MTTADGEQVRKWIEAEPSHKRVRELLTVALFIWIEEDPTRTEAQLLEALGRGEPPESFRNVLNSLEWVPDGGEYPPVSLGYYQIRERTTLPSELAQQTAPEMKYFTK